jgi:hypothetical protein
VETMQTSHDNGVGQRKIGYRQFERQGCVRGYRPGKQRHPCIYCLSWPALR